MSTNRGILLAGYDRAADWLSPLRDHWHTFVLSVLFAILLASCGSDEKNVSFKSGGMTHTFAEGKDAIPSDFPMPIYPNSEPAGSVQAQDDDEHSRFLMMSSTDSVDKISQFYQDELKKAGWTVTPNQMIASLVNLTAQRKGLEGSVMISGGDGQPTTINLQVSKEIEGVPKTSTEVYVPDNLNPPTD